MPSRSSDSGSESGSESGADEGIVAALRAEIAALRQAHAQEVDALTAGHRTELAAERARNAALASELEATRQPPEPEPEPQ